MVPIVRIDKRIPSHTAGGAGGAESSSEGSAASADRSPGSLWQRRSGYRLADRDGLARVYQPAGTVWWNPLGGWTQEHPGVAIFGERLPFVVSCHGPAQGRRFYIDIVRWSRIGPAVIIYLDLYLDVLIDPNRIVTEKDEDQLAALSSDERRSVRAARDDVRARIAAGDPLFDPEGPYYRIPPGARALPPVPPDRPTEQGLPR